VALLTSIDQALRDFLAEVVREVVREELKHFLQTAQPLRSDGATGADQYMPVKKPAEAMSVSPDAVRSWIQRGELLPHRAHQKFEWSGLVMYPADDGTFFLSRMDLLSEQDEAAAVGGEIRGQSSMWRRR